MFKKGSLLKAGTFLFTGTMVSNLCNYLFQILMGRLLSVEDYGIMNSLISLFIITAVPGITITMVTAKYTSQFKAEERSDDINGIFYGFLKTMFICVGLGFLIFLILSPYVNAYLKIPSIIPTIILGIGLSVTFLNAINLGVLQGLQHFRFLSFSFGLGSIFKLISAFILVYLGFRVSGVMTALFLSGLTVFCFTFFYLRLKGDVMPLSRAKLLKIENRNGILKFGIPVLVATIIFSILTQVDMMLIKHYFPAQEAGVYASAAVLGRAVLYLPAVIVIAFFPMVAGLHSLNQDTYPILNKGLAYTGLLSGIAVLLFWIMPEFLLKVLFGPRFTIAAPLLGIFGLAMFPLAMLGILINFNLARHKVKFIYPLLFGAIVQIGLIHFYHQTLSQVLWIMVGMGTLLLIVNLAMILWEKSLIVQTANILKEVEV